MQPRFAILAVCTANICRSPLIEMVLRSHLDVDHFEVASAGVRGWDRQPMDAMAAMELMRLGVRPGAFESRPTSPYLLESASLILTATREHRSEVLSMSPLALRRTFTLKEFAELAPRIECDSFQELVATAAHRRSTVQGDLDIADPYRRSPALHRRAADQIDVACRLVTDRLNALVPGGSDRVRS